MRNLCMALLFAVAMAACSPDPKLSTQMEAFDIVYVHDRARTNAYKVDLKNVKTGSVSLGVYVARYCEKGMENTKVGTRWDLPVTTATYPSGEVERTIHAHSLCQTQEVPSTKNTTGYQSIP